MVERHLAKVNVAGSSLVSRSIFEERLRFAQAFFSSFSVYPYFAHDKYRGFTNQPEVIALKSLKELYKIGRGPSSSHTIGPERVAYYAVENFGKGDYTAELFGSLALTGKGHGTDRVLKEVLGENTKIIFDARAKELKHPNTLKLYKTENGENVLVCTAQSVGGGSVVINGKPYPDTPEVYPQKNFAAVRKFIEENNLSLPDYVKFYEPDVFFYLKNVWNAMKESVERGLRKDGVLPGALRLERKAKTLYFAEAKFETSVMRENRKLASYAFAVAEENADNGIIVTAPTCGAAGILPAVLYYMYRDNNVPEEEILNALAAAGVVGNVVKQNASISGAECGCQAEVGVACSMAAAALSSIFCLDSDGVECSAEIALEHNLGLTCDPVLGLVQIPCIERNAVAAIEAVNAVTLSKSLKNKRKISFDNVVKVMYETGKDMNTRYRETSTGGLASLYGSDADK